jgi:hypothetical protein
MKKIWIGLFCLVCTALFSQEIPYGQEFQINTNPLPNVDIRTILLSTGKFLVYWTSGNDILGQFFSSEADKINGEFVITSIANSYSNVVSAPLANGGFVVCWDKYFQDDTYQNYDIYCQVFSSDCNKLGTEFRVNSYTTGRQDNPNINALTNGNFFICWNSNNQDDPSFDVYGQLFSPEGEKIGDEIPINTYVNGDQKNAHVTPLPNGNFLVCWESIGQGGCFSQLFSSNGSKIKKEIRINSFNGGFQWNTPTTTLLFDSFVACWEIDNLNESSCDIYSKIFYFNGEEKTGQFHVNTYTYDWQDQPKIVPTSSGGFLSCWESYGQDDSGFGIYGQVFSSNGNKIGDEFLINTNTNSDQMYPVISKLPTGNFLITWINRGCEIDGQLLSSIGKKMGTEFLVAPTHEFAKCYNTQIIPLQNNKILICWLEEKYLSGPYQNSTVYWTIYAKLFPSSPIHHILKPFVRKDPSNDSRINSEPITFSWNQATQQQICYPFEMEYDLFVSTDPEFTKPLVIQNIQDTTYSINNLQFGHTYFWKVLAKNFYGDSLWCESADWGFFIPPNDTASGHHPTCQVFSLTNPEQTVSPETNEITLNWNRASNEPTLYPPIVWYDVYIADNTNFFNAQVIKGVIDTTTTISGLTGNPTNYWKVMAYNAFGDSAWSRDIGKIQIISNAPNQFHLYQNYPNPFNALTTIRFDIPEACQVEIAIYDITGRLVSMLSNESKHAGSYSEIWNGKDSADNLMPSGIYLCRMNVMTADAKMFVQTVKLGIVR